MNDPYRYGQLLYNDTANMHAYTVSPKDVTRINLCLWFLDNIDNNTLKQKGSNSAIDLFLSWLQTKEDTPALMLVDELKDAHDKGMLNQPFLDRYTLLDLLKQWLKAIGVGSSTLGFYGATVSNDLIVATLQVTGHACTNCGGHGVMYLQNNARKTCHKCGGRRIRITPANPDTEEE